MAVSFQRITKGEQYGDSQKNFFPFFQVAGKFGSFFYGCYGARRFFQCIAAEFSKIQHEMER
jgi:hypothetical protein